MNQIIQNEDLNKLESETVSSQEKNSITNTMEENGTPENHLAEAVTEETDVIKPEEANTSNCLALTIQKEHKLVAVKNVFLHSLKVSWKVVVSAITLHILKLFF